VRRTPLTDGDIQDMFYPERVFNRQPVPEGRSHKGQFSGFSGQKCPKCHKGILNSAGDCPKCDFSAQDLHGPY